MDDLAAEGTAYRYRLFHPDGGDRGEAQLAALVTPGDEIDVFGERLRVVDVVAVMEVESPIVALLKVEPAE